MPDGRWRAEVSLGIVGGKRRRKVVYGKTKQKCLERMRTVQLQHSRGELTGLSNQTTNDYLKQWIAMRAKTVEPGTLANYQRHIDQHLGPYIGPVPLRRLTADKIQEAYRQMERDGISTSERKKIATVVRMVLKDAVKQGLIQVNPAVNVTTPRHRVEDFEAWTREEVGVFLDVARGHRLYALFVLALDSGMRQGELFALEWKDIDWTQGAVRVNKSLESINGRLRIKIPKTPKSRRTIKLSDFTMKVLKEYRNSADHVFRPTVFTNTRGGWLHRSNLRVQVFNRLITKAGVTKIRFHDLRHTSASLLLQAGVNVKVVSERLGHSRIEQTLSTYAHVMPGMQGIAAEAINLILEQATCQATKPHLMDGCTEEE